MAGLGGEKRNSYHKVVIQYDRLTRKIVYLAKMLPLYLVRDCQFHLSRHDKQKYDEELGEENE